MRFLFLVILSVFFLSGCERDKDPEPAGTGKVLVLMYHRITEGDASNIYERSIDDLESDLKYLRENNIKVISFEDLFLYTSTAGIPDGKFVILTFDDGDSSWYTLVRPLLIKYGMKATFFLWTHMIGRDSFMTWEEVALMSHFYNGKGEHPFEFGSHTFSHAYLHQRKAEYVTTAEYSTFLNYEMAESKRMIEEYIPGKVRAISLPYGDGAGDPDIIAAAQVNGYVFLRTSKWDAVAIRDVNPYIIPSVPVLDTTTPEEFGSYFE